MKYFVKNLPQSCFYCDCCHTKPYGRRYKIDGEKFCGIVNMEVNDHYDDEFYDNAGRPNWCPLREIPYKYTDVADMYRVGWNDCVDEMIRK